MAAPETAGVCVKGLLNPCGWPLIAVLEAGKAELSSATLKSSALPLLLLLEKNSAATAPATFQKK